MEIRIIKVPLSKAALAELAKQGFGEMIKAVVDIEKEKMVIDMELHADGETLLLENGSRQENLWGINLYPGKPEDSWIEFDSMINIRPAQGNRSRSVENVKTQRTIFQIVKKLTF